MFALPVIFAFLALSKSSAGCDGVKDAKSRFRDVKLAIESALDEIEEALDGQSDVITMLNNRDWGPEKDPLAMRVVASPVEALQDWLSRSSSDLGDLFSGRATLELDDPSGSGKVLKTSFEATKAQVAEIAGGYHRLAERFEGSVKPSLDFIAESGKGVVNLAETTLESLEAVAAALTNGELLVTFILLLASLSLFSYVASAGWQVCRKGYTKKSYSVGNK